VLAFDWLWSDMWLGFSFVIGYLATHMVQVVSLTDVRVHSHTAKCLTCYENCQLNCMN
jgi:hypothetical protein